MGSLVIGSVKNPVAVPNRRDSDKNLDGIISVRAGSTPEQDRLQPR